MAIRLLNFLQAHAMLRQRCTVPMTALQCGRLEDIEITDLRRPKPVVLLSKCITQPVRGLLTTLEIPRGLNACSRANWTRWLHVYNRMVLIPLLIRIETGKGELP